MDPFSNLFHQHDNYMPSDIQEDYQPPQMTQTYEQPSLLPRQAEISFPHLLPHDNTQTNWAMTPSSIINSSASPETSFCAPSSEGSVSPSPSHAYVLRAFHSALSQPSIPTLAPRGGGIPSDASPYPEAPRQDSAGLRMSPTIAQPTLRVWDPTSLDCTGLFTDNVRAANTQSAYLSHNLLEHQSAPTAYQQFPEQSCPLPATSNAHSPFSQFMDDIFAGQPSQSGSLAVTDADGSSLSPASFGSLEDLVDAHLSPELPSAPAQGALSQAVDHQLLPQSVSPAVPQPANMQLHTGKRKRVAEPKDPKAAKRLRGQRQSDDDHIQTLYDIFVPKGVGPGLKKDRLGLVTDYATKFVMAVKPVLQRLSLQPNVGVRMGLTSLAAEQDSHSSRESATSQD